jgi:hypothetical protein
MGRSCCTIVTGDEGGLGIGAGIEALVTMSTGPSVTRRLLDDVTADCLGVLWQG